MLLNLGSDIRSVDSKKIGLFQQNWWAEMAKIS